MLGAEGGEKAGPWEHCEGTLQAESGPGGLQGAVREAYRFLVTVA